MRDLVDHLGNTANIVILKTPVRMNEYLKDDSSIWKLEDCRSGSAKIGAMRRTIKNPYSQSFIADLIQVETVFIHDAGFSESSRSNSVEIHLRKRDKK